TIRAEDIGDDVRMWAQNTALKLTKALEDIKSLPMPQKQEALVSVIKESVTEAQGKRELLLMRFMLNRTLTLSEFFNDQNPALSVNYVLLPGIKKAISLYEEADLPYLEANKDKPESEIKPPAYAAFTKNTIDYLLTASNMNKTLEGQFNILKSSIVWIGNDLIRSSETKRNPINANLILDLKQKEEELKNISKPSYQINNSIRKLILKTKNEIVVETPKENHSEQMSHSEAQPKNLTSDLLGDFADIPAGTFMDENQHQVTLTNFQIMKTEVTQKMWKTIMLIPLMPLGLFLPGGNPSNFKGDNLPVENVSWNDVQVFIDRLNHKNDGYTYRLPTEAEWEYAARAGTHIEYFSSFPNYAWFTANSGNRQTKTNAVAQESSNAWGLYDMRGNVLEWVLDPYSLDYSKALSQEDADHGNFAAKDSDRRVICGGCWVIFAKTSPSAYRTGNAPDDSYYYVGFRLVRTQK
ncbi:MAG: hypothetical protein A3D19_09050, partial [Deltaproteobacteria bacterium RIFCSPHIGHO2_02_FULL_38_15]